MLDYYKLELHDIKTLCHPILESNLFYVTVEKYSYGVVRQKGLLLVPHHCVLWTFFSANSVILEK